MHVLIDEFRAQARQIRRRKQWRYVWRAALLATLAALAITAGLLWEGGRPFRAAGGDLTEQTLAIPAGETQASEQTFGIDSADKMRDPVIFQTASDTTARNKYEIRFQNVNSAADVAGKVYYVADRMLDPSAQLTTALPASPQDFALLGSASVDERVAAGDSATLTAIPDATAIGGEGGAGWDMSTLPASAPSETAAASEGISGSSVVTVIPPQQRRQGAREFIVKVLSQRSLDSVLEEAGIAPDRTAAAAEAAARLLNLRMLQPGYIAAFRVDWTGEDAGDQAIIQLAVVANHGVVGAIGLEGSNTYARVEDPWADKGLQTYAEEDSARDNENSRFRIMDGLYAAGVRNGIPPNILSEVIAQMARGYDLGAFLQPDDRFTIIYSDAARDSVRGDGHVLYASVQSAGDTLACYVLKPGRDEGFTCMTEKDTVTRKLGFIAPVNGALRSGFGPRMHPILHQLRNHQGVDWAAPPGTPVVAVFEGTVSFAGANGGYGNFIRISHPNGLATGYAHLSAFAERLAGAKVKAGETIGYVGTTGLSTGPHLHFELYVEGQPVDPFSFETPIADAGAGEKDKLIARIIRVESGGDIMAKNPLSSASGLGQFLSGTWLRMMRSYRPDLASSMGEADLLALRFEPSVAQEMLYNFAAENEADLKRAGLQATAGNLYLAHFLGSQGAISVLRAAPEESLVNLVGYQVVAANPFLGGRDAGWVIDWAARKMTGQGISSYRRLPPAVRIKNSRFAAYSEAIDKMLAAIEANKPVL